MHSRLKKKMILSKVHIDAHQKLRLSRVEETEKSLGNKSSRWKRGQRIEKKSWIKCLNAKREPKFKQCIPFGLRLSKENVWRAERAVRNEASVEEDGTSAMGIIKMF